MQKLQDSVFSIVKTTNLSPAVFSYLQPSEDFPDKTPLGGILSDTKHGWLALGPKFCVIDLRTGLKVAQRTFGTALSNFRTIVTCVVELPTPLTNNSTQLLISLECEDIAGMICVFHVNGSQILRCIQTEVVVTELAVSDGLPGGPLTCFDGTVMAGTKSGEIFVFDLNRTALIEALKSLSQGYEQFIRGEENSANITFLPLNAIQQLKTQRDLALENDDHIAILLNENSLVEGQTYIFLNPDGTVQMKARKDHVRVTAIQYIPQIGSLAVGFNFGAFQIWNLLNVSLVFTSLVNVECLPVSHFGFQEPCDDPRAFAYLWVVYSVLDRFEEEAFPLAVMYSLMYRGKTMLSDTKSLYQALLSVTIVFQVELTSTEEDSQLVGGRCVSCHSYCINAMRGVDGEESMLNICQFIWECWGENATSSSQYGMLLFDLDQWYKSQMPARRPLETSTFMSATSCSELARGATATLDVRLVPPSVTVYCAATRLEEHFYPNSLRYDCICLNTSEACTLSTTGIQRQIINSLDEVGPTALLNPTRLYLACVQTGLVPLFMDNTSCNDQEEQRRYLLSVALEARLSRFLKRCAHDWATGTHIAAGCTLDHLVDWCWKRAVDLKEHARELTMPLFTSSASPDRNVVRCIEHCVQQLSQLTGLLDAILTKCCNLVVPDALSEMEEKYKGIGTVSLYFQVVQWFLRVGLLPERQDSCNALPYPGEQLRATYNKRRIKLHRLQDHSACDDNAAKKPCPLLYIDQLIEEEFGGDRIYQMWIKGGSESGLYPPPSLYALLRLYLLPDIAEEHKHSLVLYLLVDYSMVYDEVRYETVIRRLMQFPTMFGLSNTAIKATQAFWHLDHRDFDFALDQLQCLTGNTLSDWQHHVVLSSLLAQQKTQAALQYLHVRKPAPMHTQHLANSKMNDQDKLDDWQSCCNLYLARGLVFEAMDVIRMCVQNAPRLDDKAYVLNYFYKSCRNSGQLSKLLQVSLTPFEEEVFIKYLENCNESQTSDILIMYYLQQARYLEAVQYNNRLKQSKSQMKDVTASVESLADVKDREEARDTLLEVMCSSLPTITNTVAHTIANCEWHDHIIAPKPMSVFIQAKSPKNTFVYKSSFIQDTIENASETWINKPKARRGLKRALNIEDTPFICTPKLSRAKNIFSPEQTESTPPKRARLDFTGTPRTPRNKANEKISEQLSILLEMPDVESPELYDRRGADTPHSILKTRSGTRDAAASPADSRYFGESDDELLETASNNTHYSDSTNKHLRFNMPAASESESTPSPPAQDRDEGIPTSERKERDVDMSLDSTTETHALNEPHPLESPPKKMAAEDKRKLYKDSVKGRRSLSLSVNSSLSEDPNTSIESIADIPITLINPRYSGEKRHSFTKDPTESAESANEEKIDEQSRQETTPMEIPKTPKGRPSIRGVSRESTPLKSRSVTPERIDSPVITTPLRTLRSTRSRSRTPDISPRSSPLAPIVEQPKQETESQPHPVNTMLSAPRARSRSCTPERLEKMKDSPRLEAITESPNKTSESPPTSPVRRSLRSRSRTPEVEPEKTVNDGNLSPRTLRSRAKTPEKIMSPKKDAPKSAKKPLSRLVLEANALAASKNLEKQLESTPEGNTENIIECTPMKTLKQVSSLMDVTFSPIVSKSILISDNDSDLSESAKETKLAEDSTVEMKSLPAFTMNETRFGKSVLNSVESTVEEITHSEIKTDGLSVSRTELKSIHGFTLNESVFGKSVLQSYESSVASSSIEEVKAVDEIKLKSSPASTSLNITDLNKSVLGSYDSSQNESQNKKDENLNMSSLITDDSEMENIQAEKKQDVIQKEKEKIVEIEREINEFEHDLSEEERGDNEDSEEVNDGVVRERVEEEAEEEQEVEEEEEEIPHEMSPEEENSIIFNEDEDDDDDSRESRETDDSDDSDCNPSEEEVISIIDLDESSNDLYIDEKEFVNIEKKKDAEINKEHKQESNEATEKIHESEASVDPLNQAQISMLTDDNSVAVDSNIGDSKVQKEDSNEPTKDNIQESVEGTNPLNQAQISLLTDDESLHLDKSEGKLNYSDEVPDFIRTVENKEASGDVEMKPVQESIQIQVNIEPSNVEDKVQELATKTPIQYVEKMVVSEKITTPVDIQVDPVVVDSKTTDKIDSGGKDKYSGQEDVEMAEAKDETPQTDVRVKSSEAESKTENTDLEDANKSSLRTKTRTKSTSSVKSNKDDTEIESKIENITSENVDTPSLRKKRTKSNSSIKSNKAESEKESRSEITASENVDTPSLRKKRTKSTSSIKSSKDDVDAESKSEDTASENVDKPGLRKKRTKSTSSVKSGKEEESKSEDTASENVDKPGLRKTRTKSTSSLKSNKGEISKQGIETKVESDDTAPEDIGKPALRKKRTKSTSSIKSSEDKESERVQKTPSRKRSQSVLSNQSAAEQKTPEDTHPETPSRRRAQTPTSTEVRKILTRRASKELNQSQMLDESIGDTALNITPRKSMRARSRNIDDNASVTSEGSVRSTRSKAASEDGDGKPQRKSKKSILQVAKPDLSVIPEAVVEDSKSDLKDEVMADYSRSRRLTRHQKSMLESWLEPKPSPLRRGSATSKASGQSHDDASSNHSAAAFDVQPIDRMSLLNKGDFEGSPDSSEVQSTISPESIASDASKQKRQVRAASESKSTPKAKAVRRMSVDVAFPGTPEQGSPLLARGRRASFNRACEALHTPKGRRSSTDVRKGEGSVSSSPESETPATPSRRGRKASTQSNTSISKDTSKRSKKLSAVEETDDDTSTKKK